jgi:hypothetical protein
MRQKRVCGNPNFASVCRACRGFYGPDEKTACKASLKELRVKPVDQNRLPIRRTARSARSAMAFAGSARTSAKIHGGLNRARPARRAFNPKGAASPGPGRNVDSLVAFVGGHPDRWRRAAIQSFASSFKVQGSLRSPNWAANWTAPLVFSRALSWR